MHTPVPWRIADEDAKFVYAIGPRGTNSFWAHVQAAGSERVSDEECRANAKLIAAAPDLLRELSHLVRLLETPISDGRVSAPGLATLNGAKAAIAKAQG